MTALAPVQIGEDAGHTHRSWTTERIARLGFLIGLGWDGERIAEDALIATTQNNVYRQAKRFGLAFRETTSAWGLPPDVANFFAIAAAKRSLTRDAMIRRLLLEVAADPNLLDNILDDDGV